jgi:hypothetical protein
MQNYGPIAARALWLALILTPIIGQAQGQRTATLRGQVTDQLGGAIAGATVTLRGKDGHEQATQTDERGNYRFNNAAPGVYGLHAVATGFAIYQRDLTLAEGRTETLDFKLTVAVQNQKMTVTGESLGTDPASNKSALVIKGQDLDALPDDPDDLAAALGALAGPAAGPSGADMYIDGFTAGQYHPDKQSIREIVINRNPFSAEYDRIGFGRIDVFTKPGSGKLHGGTGYIFNDSILNSRNPFVLDRPPYERRIIEANLNGPIQTGKSSFYFGFSRRDISDIAAIDATVLDRNLNIVSFSQAVTTPKTLMRFNPRLDFQLNKSNTLGLRYTYDWSDLSKQGIGGFALSSAGYDETDRLQTVQLTETSIVSSRLVNETGFQFMHYRVGQVGEDSSPAVVVLDAFSGGGSPIGPALDVRNEWELRDYMTLTAGRHTLKFGGRLRGAEITDIAPTNFAGRFLFTGGKAPELDAANQPIIGLDGNPILIDVTSIERYRRTLLFQQQGLSPRDIRALGGGAAQLVVAEGNPGAGVRQVDFGGFAQDDWKLRPGFTLSMGLRYQNQTNIRSNFNFAPRLAFAWTPWASGSGQPKTVIRGGGGIFYDLVRTPLTLQAARFNGINQTEFTVSDPTLLDEFPSVAPARVLGSLGQPQTIWGKAPDLTAPYYIQSSISIERNLPRNTNVSATYLETRGLHQLRARDINAPLSIPSGQAATMPPGGALGTAGIINEYESAGIFKQHLLVINSAIRPNKWLSLQATYTLGWTYSDTDGAGTFPAYSYDLSTEYGRASTDIRHRLTLFGSINAWWGISLNPFVIASSGAPFNITTGIDNNGDSLFTDRPSFAADLTRPSVKLTRFGAFDIAPGPGARSIPRNFGQGPGYCSVVLTAAKTFGLGSRPSPGPAQSNAQPGTNSAVKPEDRPYKLSVGVTVVNLLNHTNAGTPIGNLTSPAFGTSNSLQTGLFTFGGSGTTSNRSINIRLGFTF